MPPGQARRWVSATAAGGDLLRRAIGTGGAVRTAAERLPLCAVAVTSC
jgi:hypothetical protein